MGSLPVEPGPRAGDRPAASSSPAERQTVVKVGPFADIPPIVLAGMAVVALLLVGLVLFASGLLGSGRGPGDGPFSGASLAPGATLPPGATATLPGFPGVTAPPVGLTILSPTDGAVIGSNEVTVIGTAPAGVRITQDISFGLDRHATADGTGHWAIVVGLNEGPNRLTFRIGDDRSSAQTILVTFQRPATP